MAKPNMLTGKIVHTEDELAANTSVPPQFLIMMLSLEMICGFWMMTFDPFSYIPVKRG